MIRKAAVALLGFLLLVPSLGMTAEADSILANGFNIIGVTWGTPTSPSEPGPGEMNVPLTVTLQYFFANTATSVQSVLSLTQGFSDVNGGSNPSTYVSGSVSSGSTVLLTFYVNIGQATMLGTYTFQVSIFWGALTGGTGASSVSLVQVSAIQISLKGKPNLVFQSVQNSIPPGAVTQIPIILNNTGTGIAYGLTTTVGASSGMSILTKFPTIQSLGPNSSTGATIGVFAGSSLAGSAISLTFTATYRDPYGILQTSQQTLGLYVSASAATPVIVLTASPSLLLPGQLDNITLTAKNTGTATVGQLWLSVSTPSGVSLIGQGPVQSSLGPGASWSYVAQLYVSGSAAGSATTFTITANFIDSAGNSKSLVQSLGFYVSQPPSTSTVEVSELTSRVALGGSSDVSFKVTNLGPGPLFNPIFSLSFPSPLSVTGNATYAYSRPIAPGETVTFTATVSNGPKSAEAAVTGTLQVVFQDSVGSSHTSSFSVGVLVVGVIKLAIQSPQVVQGGTNLTVTGTLLNEGTASAYYLSLGGSLGRGASQLTDYIGEVDPNTPLPFTLTVPVQAQTNAGRQNLTILARYQNDLGESLNFQQTTAVTLGPTSGTAAPASTSNQSTAASTFSMGTVDLVRYALFAVILLGVAGTALYVLRSRSRRRGGRTKSGVF